MSNEIYFHPEDPNGLEQFHFTNGMTIYHASRIKGIHDFKLNMKNAGEISDGSNAIWAGTYKNGAYSHLHTRLGKYDLSVGYIYHLRLHKKAKVVNGVGRLFRSIEFFRNRKLNSSFKLAASMGIDVVTSPQHINGLPINGEYGNEVAILNPSIITIERVEEVLLKN